MKKPKKTAAAKKSSPVKRAMKKTRAIGRSRRNRSFPVIGMGGSAGSFKAFEAFFTHMPADSGMAFVIVMNHDPNNKTRTAELVQKFTPMPVMEAEDGMKVQPDHVYIIPPDKDMGIHNGQLLLLKPANPRGHRMPIDYFFQSLAEDQGSKAVGIILSGMGSDGETGIRMIKEKLGMAMVQDPVTSEYESMPKSAISTNLVDYALSPEEMPIKLIQYLKHPLLVEEPDGQAISDSKNANAIQKVLMMLRSQTGHDFSLYKKNTITRRIDRRIAFHLLPDYASYVNYLRENPHEINVLFNELLIGVTKFFRDTYAFDALKERLYPVFRSKPLEEPIRVWVPGCSTGEEAYSIAIIIMEYLEGLKIKKLPKVQIFATDLDADSIDHARQGVYLGNIVADVSPERLEKYFIDKSDHFIVKKELREMIVFAQHNIIKDAPFTRLDLLSCRNLMIYLTTELQKKIIPIFHYSLNPKGLLFLGPAESIGGFIDMFMPLDAKWKLFERKEGASTMNRMIDFPFNVSNQGMSLFKPDPVGKLSKKSSLQETFNKILLENYTPPSLLVNDKGDILYINGRPGRYLELSSGEAMMNIHRIAREELKYALSNAIHQARQQKGVVSINEIKLKENNAIRLVNLRVAYLDDAALQGLVLVAFEDCGLVSKPDTNAKKKGPARDIVVEELEKELMYTKQQLHSTIEQMETSVEELKSTNEELQSTNEELQSTNEESLTTKEEMQSLNEELMTINTQYQIKAEELNQLNNDMKNMLDNIEIGTIFLDNSLNILRFTPQVKRLFNLIPSDVGRSITHIVSNFDRASLEDDIGDVIEKLAGKELEVKTKKGEWYSLRIMPYRTMDNFINGAVLSFSKITAIKEMERKLSLIQRSSALLLDSMKSPALLLDESMKVLAVNQTFLRNFRLKEQELKGQSLADLAHNRWKTDKLDGLLAKPGKEGSIASLQHDFPGIGMKKITVTARPLMSEENGDAAVLIIMEDKQ